MLKEIDAYLNNTKYWQKELATLRAIALDCGLTETFKWRQPCYTFRKSNVFILGEFKDFCTLAFFKGVLLKDTHQLLKKQGKNTQAGRIITFTDVEEIRKLEPLLKSYIFEAIEVEKAGLKLNKNEVKEIIIPDELKQIYATNPLIKKAFEALTPGRQRGYIIHFTGTQNSKTRIRRIEKFVPRILNGKGMNDCICGHSRRMPNCDGSHKQYDAKYIL